MYRCNKCAISYVQCVRHTRPVTGNIPLPQWRGLFWMFHSTFHTTNYCKKCACHKGTWRSSRLPPLILSLCTKLTKATFPSVERDPGIHWTGAERARQPVWTLWVKYKSVVPRIEPRFIARTVFSLSFFLAQQPLVGQESLHYRGFTITLRHTTLGRTPLGEWSARCRDLYLTTHNTHKRQTSMTLVGFEPAIPATERSPKP